MPSSVIHNFVHDPKTGVLTVTFTTGRRYAYAGVAAEVVEGMRQSRSKGRYFNRHVRDHYPATELDTAFAVLPTERRRSRTPSLRDLLIGSDMP